MWWESVASLRVPGSHFQGIRVPCPRFGSPESQGPSSSVPSPRVPGNGSQILGLESLVLGPGSQDPESKGPRSWVLILDYAVLQYGVSWKLTLRIPLDKWGL